MHSPAPAGVSTPALAYLYAHDIVPQTRSMRHTETFTGTKVPTRELTKLLLTLGVLEVLDQGDGQIVEVDKKVLFKTKKVKVLQSRGMLAGPTLTGRISQTAAQGVPLEDLLLKMIGSTNRDPDHWVLERVREELHARGFARKEETGKAKGMLKAMLSSTSYKVDPGAAQTARVPFEALAANWRGRQSPLIAELLDKMDKAIGKATESDSGSWDSGD